MGWYLHSFVPKSQLSDKITEYSEYIKITIIAVLLLVIAYFTIKILIKRYGNTNKNK